MGEKPALQAEHTLTAEVKKPASLQAVIVCGMGPVRLANLATEQPMPLSPLNRLNGFAAKQLAADGVADTVIVSGTHTGKLAPNPTMQELATSEGAILEAAAVRMKGKSISKEAHAKAAEIIVRDEEAQTTFDNIIQGINILDERNNGHFDGQFGVVSAEFHMPRIAEMLQAFGFADARAISSEQVLRHAGYNKLYPTGDFGYGMPFEQFEEDIYKGQPAGLWNLQINPSYVTFELAKVHSDRRLQEMASSVKDYYTQRGIPLPDVYTQIPATYDAAYDYGQLRKGFNQIPFTKLPYTGVVDTASYRSLAKQFSQQTEEFLISTA